MVDEDPSYQSSKPLVRNCGSEQDRIQIYWHQILNSGSKSIRINEILRTIKYKCNTMYANIALILKEND